jgi:hypothetical protein
MTHDPTQGEDAAKRDAPSSKPPTQAGDPRELSIGELRGLVTRAGFRSADGFRLALRLGVDAVDCLRGIETALGDLLSLYRRQVTGVKNPHGWLDPDKILAYDAERTDPCGEDVAMAIHAIADKPHRAPVILTEMIGSCLRAAFDDAAHKAGEEQAPTTPGEPIEGAPTRPGRWCVAVGPEWFAVDVRGPDVHAVFRHPTMRCDVSVLGYRWAKAAARGSGPCS